MILSSSRSVQGNLASTGRLPVVRCKPSRSMTRRCLSTSSCIYSILGSLVVTSTRRELLAPCAPSISDLALVAGSSCHCQLEDQMVCPNAPGRQGAPSRCPSQCARAPSPDHSLASHWVSSTVRERAGHRRTRLAKYRHGKVRHRKTVGPFPVASVPRVSAIQELTVRVIAAASAPRRAG